ncbi:hypothetical protein BHE74_00036148 [Ensete ventricosum]|nr:hypothetical protein BHE74_00036148 [Ensete ventricosum]
MKLQSFGVYCDVPRESVASSHSRDFIWLASVGGVFLFATEGSWTWGPLPLGHMTDRWRQADPTFRTGFQQPVRDHSQHRTNPTHREHHPLARADLAVNATATVSRAGRHRALRRH